MQSISVVTDITESHGTEGETLEAPHPRAIVTFKVELVG
jgi:hypothetical protein